jgi:hypothetical protein
MERSCAGSSFLLFTFSASVERFPFSEFQSGGHNSLSVLDLQLAGWQLVPGIPT